MIDASIGVPDTVRRAPIKTTVACFGISGRVAFRFKLLGLWSFRVAVFLSLGQPAPPDRASFHPSLLVSFPFPHPSSAFEPHLTSPQHDTTGPQIEPHPAPRKMSPSSSPTTAPPNMSPATKELLARVRQMIPPMLDKFHKGAARPLETAVWHECRYTDGLADDSDDDGLCRTAGASGCHWRQRGLHGCAVLFGHGERQAGV
jgi:hypothetical protein